MRPRTSSTNATTSMSSAVFAVSEPSGTGQSAAMLMRCETISSESVRWPPMRTGSVSASQ